MSNLIMHMRETHRKDIEVKSKYLVKQENGSGFVVKIKVHSEDYRGDDKKYFRFCKRSLPQESR